MRKPGGGFGICSVVTESSAPLALQVQDIPAGTDRVLVIGSLAAQRAEDASFSPGDIAKAFDAFRLPAPGNVSQSLAQLRARDLVVRRRAGGWSLTPKGEARVTQLLGQLPAPDAIDAGMGLAGDGAAELGEGKHTVIPPFFAPAKWSHAIGRFLERYPFDENVFCMTRYASADALDPVRDVIETTRTALKSHGLTLHLASDANTDDDLWSNVAGYLWACRYGIALFENRVGKGLNYNLVIEVGAMLATGRRCALLKDTTQPDLPTDLVGQIYRSVDFDDLDQVNQAVHDWAANDLGFGRCNDCP
jgi:hypothetical protein